MTRQNKVLLYNFFSDSKVAVSQWRVVLNASKWHGDVTVAPHFNEIRHAGVCSEVRAYPLQSAFSYSSCLLQLKFLYVAITRARKNMWIVDCSDKGEPMRVGIAACNYGVLSLISMIGLLGKQGTDPKYHAGHQCSTTCCIVDV